MNSKRLLDIFACLIIFGLFFYLFFLIWFIVKVTSKGPVLYWSRRIGKDNQSFMMPKFRTMHLGTPDIATHLLENPYEHLTLLGLFLRKSSLDELPQIWSILKGDMSLVGPRPALYNQNDLVELRTINGIHKLKPGLTGWAQANGRDDLPIEVKVEFDKEYLKRQSFLFDLKILWLTFLRVIRREGIAH